MIVGVLCTELYGSNLHLWDVRPEILTFATKLLIVTQCLFASSAALTKISMNLLVCRIVSKGTSRIRIVAKIASCLIGLNALVFCLVIIFQCNPVSLYWTWSFEKQNCINQTLHVLIAGCINTFFDCVTVLLPIPLVWKLNLPLRQKVVVFVLFFAGVVVCIAGCVRTVYTYRLSVSYDQTWACYSVWLSSTVELYIGIVSIDSFTPDVSSPAVLRSVLDVDLTAITDRSFYSTTQAFLLPLRTQISVPHLRLKLHHLPPILLQ